MDKGPNEDEGEGTLSFLSDGYVDSINAAVV